MFRYFGILRSNWFNTIQEPINYNIMKIVPCNAINHKTRARQFKFDGNVFP